MHLNRGMGIGWSNAFKLMRIPFSIYLMPIFWFALSSMVFNWYSQSSKALLIFFILHFLVYPASNGYNSYCDKDEESVGGLEKPPLVTQQLYYLVLIFDFAALLLSIWVNIYFAIGIFIYLLVSKAYSYDKIRLKKYPFLSTAVVTIFQGMFVYLLIQIGILGNLTSINGHSLYYSLVATLFLLGSYPITQIYQHESDAKRGDMTLSRKLGISGTFVFSAIFFFMATSIFCYLKYDQGYPWHVYTYLFISFPILLYFAWWRIGSLKDPSKIDYHHTMLMNKISSLSMSLIFIVNLFS